MRIEDYDSECDVANPADIETALSKRLGPCFRGDERDGLSFDNFSTGSFAVYAV
jgi:hypothetical protein